MSILIPGMEMPTSCSVCPMCGLYSEHKGDVHRCDITFYPVEYEEGLEKRHKDCPLIPVPERGQILQVLKIERECVRRYCDRDCGTCDLSLKRDEILNVYDTLIALFADSAEEEEG